MRPGKRSPGTERSTLSAGGAASGTDPRTPRAWLPAWTTNGQTAPGSAPTPADTTRATPISGSHRELAEGSVSCSALDRQPIHTRAYGYARAAMAPSSRPSGPTGRSLQTSDRLRVLSQACHATRRIGRHHRRSIVWPVRVPTALPLGSRPGVGAAGTRSLSAPVAIPTCVFSRWPSTSAGSLRTRPLERC